MATNYLLDQTQEGYYDTGIPSPQGNYQFISIRDIVSNFMVAYVGEDKIISKIKRGDVSFHAQRAQQELSYDTFKSTKSQEIVLPPSLTFALPHDYVNYVKLTWVDGAGMEHVIYPAIKTSNPLKIKQETDGDYKFSGDDLDTSNSSTTNERYKAATGESSIPETFWEDGGQGYGLETNYNADPQYSQSNGTFFIDPNTGLIHFSSNIAGKVVILKYISDGLGTEEEMQVHKFAEEAMYKWIAHAILATRANTQEYIVARFKKEKKAAIRTAKLRMSNLKLEEITQILRGKSKQIKH